jgi:hypothetical protein
MGQVVLRRSQGFKRKKWSVETSGGREAGDGGAAEWRRERVPATGLGGFDPRDEFSL